MTFILIWIVCGIAASAIASGKGRDGMQYGCLGVLLGPLGVVLALVASRDENAVRAQAVQDGGMRKCPMCAELVRREAVKCRFCGSELPPVSVEAPLVVTRPSETGFMPAGSRASSRLTLVIAAAVLALVVVGALMQATQRSSGAHVERPADSVGACIERGEAYYRSIGSYPALSDGRLAYDVALQRCSSNAKAF